MQVLCQNEKCRLDLVKTASSGSRRLLSFLHGYHKLAGT